MKNQDMFLEWENVKKEDETYGEKIQNSFSGAKTYAKKLGRKVVQHAESDEGLNGALGALGGAALGEAMLGLPTFGMVAGFGVAVYSTVKKSQ